MATITVFSKIPNDVTFSLYEHRKNISGETIQSVPTREITIKGVTNWLRENNKKFIYINEISETIVDKDIWDAIIAERGSADPLLSNGLIYSAKSTVEAKAILKDTPRGISELGTDSTLKQQNIPKQLI